MREIPGGGLTSEGMPEAVRINRSPAEELGSAQVTEQKSEGGKTKGGVWEATISSRNLVVSGLPSELSIDVSRNGEVQRLELRNVTWDVRSAGKRLEGSSTGNPEDGYGHIGTFRAYTSDGQLVVGTSTGSSAWKVDIAHA